MFSETLVRTWAVWVRQEGKSLFGQSTRIRTLFLMLRSTILEHIIRLRQWFFLFWLEFILLPKEPSSSSLVNLIFRTDFLFLCLNHLTIVLKRLQMCVNWFPIFSFCLKACLTLKNTISEFNKMNKEYTMLNYLYGANTTLFYLSFSIELLLKATTLAKTFALGLTLSLAINKKDRKHSKTWTYFFTLRMRILLTLTLFKTLKKKFQLNPKLFTLASALNNFLLTNRTLKKKKLITNFVENLSRIQRHRFTATRKTKKKLSLSNPEFKTSTLKL